MFIEEVDSDWKTPPIFAFLVGLIAWDPEGLMRAPSRTQVNS